VSFHGMTWNGSAIIFNADSFRGMLLPLNGMMMEWHNDYIKWHVVKLKSNRNIDVYSVEW